MMMSIMTSVASMADADPLLPPERRSIALVHWVIRARAIAPEPAQHFGHHRPALFVRVRADTPAMVHVVSFLGERGGHVGMLRMLLTLRIVCPPCLFRLTD